LAVTFSTVVPFLSSIETFTRLKLASLSIFFNETPINLLSVNNVKISAFNSLNVFENWKSNIDESTNHISAGFHLSECIDISSVLAATLYALYIFWTKLDPLWNLKFGFWKYLCNTFADDINVFNQDGFWANCLISSNEFVTSQKENALL